MKIKTNFLIAYLFLGASFNLYSQSNYSEIETIKRNFKDIYIDADSDSPLMKELSLYQPGFVISDRVVMELQQRVPFDKERIDGYIKNIRMDGSWSDINYKDKKRSGWEPRLHPERILEMVKAFVNPDVEYFKSSVLEKTIHSAMDYWFKAGLKCSNWYYNQIGVPRTMGTAFILFDDYLTTAERENAVKVMENSKFGMTGQNKVWLAGNVMMKAVLSDDISLVKQARDTIVSEIVKGGAEGIKEDWSFHQHGPQQQFGNYGLAYIYTMSLLSGIFADTSMAFDEEQFDILSNLISEGYQWIIWNGKMDISAMGRQLFDSAPIHKALSTAFAANSLGGETASQFLSNCFSSKNNFVGHKHFWQSDYTITRRHDWMASLKMASQRVIGVEALNGDNMRGYYMADGALYIYKDGTEYLDIFPLWDWRRLPGITAYMDDTPVPMPSGKEKFSNRSNFVGGLSDGKNGISAMLLRRDNLKTDKFWLFADSAIVCLGAGITSDSTLQVCTSVEQSWHKDDILVMQDGKKLDFNSKTSVISSDLRVLHNGIAYIFPKDGTECSIEIAKKTGNWHNIMQTYSDKKSSGSVFSIYISHGAAPDNASYQYIILPEATVGELKHFNPESYKIMRNDKEIQAVMHNDVCWVSVKSPSEMKVSPDTEVNFLTPGLYSLSLKGGKVVNVMFSDPTCQLDTVSFLINNAKKSMSLPEGFMKGTKVSIQL